MKKIITSILLICLTIFTPTITLANEIQTKNMLEIRDIQTHYFNTKDKEAVLKAVINTLQDNGFIIQNIENDFGFIRSKKEVKLKRTMKGRIVAYSGILALNTTSLILSFGLNPTAVFGIVQDTILIKNEIAPHTVIFDSNILVDTIGEKTKVRFSVIEKILENADGYTTVKSSPRKVVRHYSPEIYQEFFNQVDKNLFIENTL